MKIGWFNRNSPVTAEVTKAIQAVGAEVVSSADAAESCDLLLFDATTDDEIAVGANVPAFLVLDSSPSGELLRRLNQFGTGLVRTTALEADLRHAMQLTEALLAAAPRRMRLPASLVRSEVCHRLPNDRNLSAIWAAEVGREAIERLEWPTLRAFQLASAAAELVENAMLRGNLEISAALADAGDAAMVAHLVEARRRQSPYRERMVWASCRFSPEEVCLVIRDEGPGFPEAADWPMCVRVPPLGRGGLILRALCTSVRYNADGNEVTVHVHATDAPPRYHDQTLRRPWFPPELQRSGR